MTALRKDTREKYEIKVSMALKINLLPQFYQFSMLNTSTIQQLTNHSQSGVNNFYYIHVHREVTAMIFVFPFGVVLVLIAKFGTKQLPVRKRRGKLQKKNKS